MKNLCLFIALLLLGVNNGFGQNFQNAKWIFGNNAGLNFNTFPPSPINLPTSVGFNQLEGCASVSDQNGNLLFFTDGIKIWHFWNGSYQIITDQLKGNYSSAQNAIIVSKPENPDRYYVVTIDGASGQKKGLYYSEIDLTNGLGQMVSLNIPLKDPSGNPIIETYDNLSEALTSTTHSDGSQYWIITHIKNTISSKLYSYLVTSNGIGPTPAYDLSFPLTNSAFSLKISPDTQKIVLGTINGAFLGTFDNTAGSFTMNSNPIGTTNNVTVYGVEFSPNSKILYYAHPVFNAYPIVRKIDCINVSSPGIEFTVTTKYDYGSLQLAIDGKIYVKAFGESGYLSSIGDPDNITNPGFHHKAISLNGTCYFGLPQWVHTQLPQQTCPSTIYLSSTNDDVLASSQDNRQASNIIFASNTIYDDAIAIYHAGDQVFLLDGFFSAEGSRFRAYPEGCTGNYVGKSAGGKELKDEKEIININEQNILTDKKNIVLYPNPATDFIAISLENSKIKQVTVSSIDSKTVYSNTVENSNSYQLNFSDYQKGIYILTVETVDGEKIIEKLIKK